MSDMTAELLSAFHDRELEPADSVRLRAFLDGDDDAQALLESFGRVDEAVRDAFDAELDAPVPLALARTVRSGFAARRRRNIGAQVVRWVGPMAAALAIVVAGHQWSLRQAEQAMHAREMEIASLTNQAVQDALEHALSGAAVQVSDSALASTVSITPTRTYRSQTEHWCREFTEELVIDGEKVKRFGLACREDKGGWRRIQTQQEGAMPPPVTGRSL